MSTTCTNLYAVSCKQNIQTRTFVVAVDIGKGKNQHATEYKLLQYHKKLEIERKSSSGRR